MFLVGCILYTVGSALATLFSFSVAGIYSFVFVALSTAVVALPVIGVWKIYRASINRQATDGILGALTLFKISAIITIVLISIALLLGLVLVVSIRSEFDAVDHAIASGLGMFFMTFLVMVMVVGVVMFILAIPLYFIPLFRILKSIREGIAHNAVDNLRGVGVFTVVSFILLGFAILGSLFSFDITTPVLLANSVGMLLLIISLRKFANDLRDKKG